MDCLNAITALLLSCLLNGTYVSAGLETEVHQGFGEGRWCTYHWCRGPMGVLKLGTRIDLTRVFDLDLGISHTSYLNTSRDEGIESVYLTLTWRPFR